MDKRENALQKALEVNEQEKQRWTQYVEDNEIAMQNLDMFSKHLEVEVMVPVGRKMLMFGHLRHTNEVLVGQFQGYFSKCSAHQAKQICNKRIEFAREHLKKLEQEEHLWQNNLELPYKEGMFANAEQEEIIEAYDEEQEALWREKHRLSVQQQKLREKAERENLTKNSDKSIEELLEEKELMEELEQELQKLEIDESSNETVKKLIGGEMSVPAAKPRVAHNLKTTQVEEQENSDNDVVDDDDDDFDDDDEELRAIKLELRLLPRKAQKTFLQRRMKIIKNKMTEIKLSTVEDLEEKTRLYYLHDELQEMLDLIEDTAEEQDLSKKQRKISFALHDDTLEFRRNETVAQMLPQTDKDIITLNAPISAKVENKIVDKKEVIKARVEQSVQFMHENQSQQDFSLVDKIIGTNLNYPLLIKFQHSDQESYKADSNLANAPTAPADFYERYLQQKNKENILYVDAFEGESDVHVPILREEKHAKAYESNISKFSKPATETAKKSILCNKDAVNLENHLVEKNVDLTGKYVDTHAPKKRISNFRKLRETEKVERLQKKAC